MGLRTFELKFNAFWEYTTTWISWLYYYLEINGLIRIAEGIQKRLNEKP